MHRRAMSRWRWLGEGISSDSLKEETTESCTGRSVRMFRSSWSATMRPAHLDMRLSWPGTRSGSNESLFQSTAKAWHTSLTVRGR